VDDANILGSFDWHPYLGFGLFTADNQRIGVVEEVGTDPFSGEAILIVRDDHPSNAPLCIPARKIGIISRFRLMLDLVGPQVPVSEWRQPAYYDRLQARRYGSTSPKGTV
jgi:hypothetical protein